MSATAMSSSLQELVQNELVWDPQVNANTIGVTSKDGSVTLTGYVPSYAEKIAAERAALRVQGTRAVANDLVVRLDSDRIDPEVARDAADALKFNLSIPKTIKAVVHNGYVTLEGTCEWYFQREAAEHAVAHLHGVKGVTNLVSVKPRASASIVKTRIEDALRRSAEVDAGRVAVMASGDKVVLTGKVKSYAERAEAARAAWASPGVSTVDNRIEVTP
jgi:osmotically-inducible protein OsmY